MTDNAIRIGDSRRAELERSWIVAHAWVEGHVWDRADDDERARILERLAKQFAPFLPGSGHPGPWIVWAGQRIGTDYSVLIRCEGRAW